MKRYLGLIVAVVGFIAAGSAIYSKYKTKTIEAEKEVNAANIKAEYLERVGWIRSNPDEKAYKDEVLTFMRWYGNQINDHLNRFGGNRDFDEYLNELELKKKSGPDAQVAEKKNRYARTKAVWDALRTGKYAPVFSATDKGMRLDIASADVKMEGGKPHVRFELVLWGAQRELREDGRTKRMVTSASFGVNWKLFDDKGKLYGEMNASGDPSMKIDYPELYIAEFPPQIVLGHYDMDLMPAEVTKMEMSFTVASRAPSGGEANAMFTWKLDAPLEWKLKAGEKWEGAQESVRPEEEIDPAAAARHGTAHK